jgi:hypothetical protein
MVRTRERFSTPMKKSLEAYWRKMPDRLLRPMSYLGSIHHCSGNSWRIFWKFTVSGHRATAHTRPPGARWNPCWPRARHCGSSRPGSCRAAQGRTAQVQPGRKAGIHPDCQSTGARQGADSSSRISKELDAVGFVKRHGVPSSRGRKSRASGASAQNSIHCPTWRRSLASRR